ncbi:Cytochrome d ubiquinol oxidase subunit II [Micrococcus lylae]|uniref:Cytochrome d ubiquinol oxidase subunit II n=1 Tax=Micrococcus lylae TaxID=1273 RepID=A0A1R4J015_9MICC|nr:cytochrome d ubiquinol oxidase subunit II [Micrococcus lylae]SJN25437.1 Cytochrome d ubiquinol oxidase subunit II [Micrococcus lylae]
MAETLPTIWFALIGVLWLGYLLLEGFDLGVGMLMRLWARDERSRRQLLNTIGPVWDGNEVWLLTAGGATFAAFPHWYASLFSALYLPLTLTLVGLILRAVAIEYRGKAITDAGRAVWDACLAGGSLLAAFTVGAMLALTTTGLPLDANGDRVGGPFVWITPYALLGGVAVVLYAIAQAWAFLGLKTDGAAREAARRVLGRWLPVLVAPLALWVVLVVARRGAVLPWVLTVLAVVALAAAWMWARAGREGLTFAAMAGFLAAGVAALFTAVYPVVLPSTIDPAYSLTVENASSGAYTLTVMAWVTVVFVPIVLAYTAWSYWTFRRRIAVTHIPTAHAVRPV